MRICWKVPLQKLQGSRKCFPELILLEFRILQSGQRNSKRGCPMKRDDEFKIAKNHDDQEGLVWVLIIGLLAGVLLAIQMF
jgi:hypothetical protein